MRRKRAASARMRKEDRVSMVMDAVSRKVERLGRMRSALFTFATFLDCGIADRAISRMREVSSMRPALLIRSIGSGKSLRSTNSPSESEDPKGSTSPPVVGGDVIFFGGCVGMSSSRSRMNFCAEEFCVVEFLVDFAAGEEVVFLCFSMFFVGDGGVAAVRKLPSFACGVCFVVLLLVCGDAVVFLVRYAAMDEPRAVASVWKERAVTLCSADCFVFVLMLRVSLGFSAILMDLAAERRRARRGDLDLSGVLGLSGVLVSVFAPFATCGLRPFSGVNLNFFSLGEGGGLVASFLGDPSGLLENCAPFAPAIFLLRSGESVGLGAATAGIGSLPLPRSAISWMARLSASVFSVEVVFGWPGDGGEEDKPAVKAALPSCGIYSWVSVFARSSAVVNSRRGLDGGGEISEVIVGRGVICRKGVKVVISGAEDGVSSVFWGLGRFFGFLVLVVWPGGPESRVELTVRSLRID